jgi:hypothetical protein
LVGRLVHVVGDRGAGAVGHLTAIAVVALVSVMGGGTDDRPAAAAAEEGVTVAGPEDEGTSADECSREITPEEIATMQADEDALAAYLDGLGIEHRMVDLGVLGVRTVEWDTGDPAANEAVEDFWDGRDPMPPADVAVYNEHEEALAAHFDAVGIAYTVDTDPDGARTVEWDYDDPAANAAFDEWSTSMTTPEEAAALDVAGC